MNRPLRFSLRDLLMLTALAALSLTLGVQYWRHHEAKVRHESELVKLHNRLYATQQMLEELPVDDSARACVLATPAFAYARWAWRVYLPPGSRYAFHVDVGHLIETGSTRQITADQGHTQHLTVQGDGETVVVVERFIQDNRQLLGSFIVTLNRPTCW